MKIGFMEIVVILVVALLVIGPDKFPEYAKKFGKAVREFKKASTEITKDIREEVVEPLDEIQRPIREAVEPITGVTKEVQDGLNSMTKGFTGTIKPKPKTAVEASAETPPAAPAVENSGTATAAEIGQPAPDAENPRADQEMNTEN